MTSPNGLGALYLIDASVLARVRRYPAVGDMVDRCIVDGTAATCVTIDLETGYSSIDRDELRRVSEYRQRAYVVLPVNESIAQRARDIQVLMAARGLHRAAGAFDILTAAIAEHHGATILHYDADFEHIAAATGQGHLWVAPRGALD